MTKIFYRYWVCFRCPHQMDGRPTLTSSASCPMYRKRANFSQTQFMINVKLCARIDGRSSYVFMMGDGGDVGSSDYNRSSPQLGSCLIGWKAAGKCRVEESKTTSVSLVASLWVNELLNVVVWTVLARVFEILPPVRPHRNQYHWVLGPQINEEKCQLSKCF